MKGKMRSVQVSKPNGSLEIVVLQNQVPLTGTIDEIGKDIQSLKDMGVDHIIFGYNFVPIERDVDKMISLSKELSKFAR